MFVELLNANKGIFEEFVLDGGNRNFGFPIFKYETLLAINVVVRGEGLDGDVFFDDVEFEFDFGVIVAHNVGGNFVVRANTERYYTFDVLIGSNFAVNGNGNERRESEVVVSMGDLITAPRLQIVFRRRIIDLKIEVEDAAKYFGESDPVFSSDVVTGGSWLESGDRVVLSRKQGTFIGVYESVGVYEFEAAFRVFNGSDDVTHEYLGNGSLTIVNLATARFEIKKRPIVIILDIASRVYGDADSVFGYTVDTGGGRLPMLSGHSFTVTRRAAASQDVGIYSFHPDYFQLNFNVSVGENRIMKSAPVTAIISSPSQNGMFLSRLMHNKENLATLTPF
jgi:hypothetical protein